MDSFSDITNILERKSRYFFQSFIMLYLDSFKVKTHATFVIPSCEFTVF